MNQTALVFPGQGSQFVGMGRDLCAQYPEAQAVFETADAALGQPLSRLCFEGPEPELTDTVNAQPAILTHSIAVFKVLLLTTDRELGSDTLTAGHSLGEYSALVAAGALEFADAVRLVRARGEAMKRAGELHPGAMAAILGLDNDKLAALCAEAGAVQVANLNAPGQVVISGDKAAMDRAVSLAKQAGAKRAMPLAVSIAAHSELMRPAVEEFRRAVEATPIQPPRMTVVSNVSVAPLMTPDEIRTEMLAQLTSPVQWIRTIEWMVGQGVSEFLELGPKDVLAGLIRRIVPAARAMSIGAPANLQAYSLQQSGG